MDLKRESGPICSTPVKNSLNMTTSTPSATDKSGETPPKKRMKYFHTRSSSWDEMTDFDGYDSFEEVSPEKVQTSFEITCNELKLTNSVLHETLMLIKDMDQNLETIDVDKNLAQERKGILKQELFELLSQKNVLENSIKAKASSYIEDPENTIDKSFLNDTVLSNLNLTLKLQDDFSTKSCFDKTVIDCLDGLDNTILSNIDTTVTEIVNDGSSIENTLIADSDGLECNTIITNSQSTINTNSQIETFVANKISVESSDESNAVPSNHGSSVRTIHDSLQCNEDKIIHKTDKHANNSILTVSSDSSQPKNDHILSVINSCENACIIDDNISTTNFEVKDILLSDPCSSSQTLYSTAIVNRETLEDDENKAAKQIDNIGYETKSKHVNNSTLIVSSDSSKPMGEDNISTAHAKVEDILLSDSSSSSQTLYSKPIVNTETLENDKNKSTKHINNIKYETRPISPPKFILNNDKAITKQPICFESSTKNNIEFENSIIIMNENVIQKLQQIKSDSVNRKELNEKIEHKKSHEYNLSDINNALGLVCEKIASLRGKHNSSDKIKTISKDVLSKCELLVNRMRDINNSLLTPQMQNDILNKEIIANIDNIKQNVQYVYEVIHAVVNKSDLKKVRAPYISKDSKENEDNYDPKWDVLRLLETDEERYKAVRKRWLNLCIPDPHSNITYRTRRYALANNNNHSVRPLTKDTRTEPYEKYYEIKANTVQQQHEILLIQLNSRETIEVQNLFLMHKQEQENLIRNCPRHLYRMEFKNMYDRQMRETRSLKANYGHERHMLISTQQSTLSLLRSLKNDTQSFLKFYDGLNGQKALTMTEAELQEALETDQMISRYEDFYNNPMEKSNTYMRNDKMIFRVCHNANFN